MTRFFHSRPGRWPALAVLGLLLGTAACTSDEELNNRAAGKTETPAAPVAATTADASKPAPLRVNMFLELSGGMKGFMPVNTAATEPTEFQDYVSQLASRTHSSPAVADAQFLLALQDTPTVTTYKHFRDVVQGDTREAAKGTELPDMLENMLALPGATDKVNVVVSDFIYGPQDKSAIALMKVRMTDALATVSKKQLAVAMLASTSRFHGTFHPAVKTPQKQLAVTGQPLPYYVWVIGPPAQVGRYLNEVTPGGEAQQAFFGLALPKVDYTAVLTQVKAGSALAPGGEGSVSFATGEPSTQLDVSDVSQTVEFTVALNLAQLPAAWREPAFLNKNLRARLNGGAVSIVPNSVQLTKDEAALGDYTHTLRLRLTALPKDAATLQLTLPAPETPAWVAAWSTQNDNQLSDPPHTYRLGDVVAGVRGAFPTPLPPVFTASFTLTQD
jgi:hypothetical protein